MNKILKIIGFMLLSSIFLTFLSCLDDGKGDNLTPNIAYIVNSGVQETIMYDKGVDNSFVFKLGLYKSGIENTGAVVEIITMTEDELSAYNAKYSTNFTLLDEDSYKIEKYKVEFTDDRKDVNQVIDIVFNPAKIDASDINSVLPIRIKDASISINDQKSICIIHPKIKLPMIGFINSGIKKTEYKKRKLENIYFDISIQLDIDSNDWDVAFEVESRADFVQEYNLLNATNYTLLDASKYNLEKTGTILKGEKDKTIGLTILGESLDLGSYMLPIKLKSSSKFSVSSDDVYALAIDVVEQAPLSRDGWTIIDFNTQELTGEGDNGKPELVLDGDFSTYWHSLWQGGLTSLPHYLVIDMQKECELTQIRLLGRQNSNYKDTKAGEFSLSKDNKSWTKIGDFRFPEGITDMIFPVTISTGRYLKVSITETNRDRTSSLAEIIPYE